MVKHLACGGIGNAWVVADSRNGWPFARWLYEFPTR